MDEDFLYLIEFEYAWILPLIFSILSNRIWMNILTDSLHHWIFLLPLNLPFYLIEYFCYYLPSILLNIYFCYHLPSILHYKYVVLFIILLYISTYFTLPTYFPHYLTYYLPKQTNKQYIYIYIYEIYKTIFQLSFIPTILYIYYITYFTNTYIHLPLIQKNTKNKHTIYHTIFPLQKITPTYIYIYLSYYIYISSYTIIYILLILLSYHSLSTSSYSQKSESRENHIQQKPTILQNRIEMNRMKKSNTFPILVIL